MAMTETTAFMTAREVADFFGISERTVWRWSRDRRGFPIPVRFGHRTVRFRRVHVEGYASRQEQASKRRIDHVLRQRGSREKSLLWRQRRFVEAYIRSGNATRSAIAAGYSDASAYSTGSELLAKPAVRSAIETAQKDYGDEIGIDAETYLARLCEMSEAQLSDIFDEDNNLKPVHEWPSVWQQGLVRDFDIREKVLNDGTKIRRQRISLWDRTRILKMIGEHKSIRAYERWFRYRSAPSSQPTAASDLRAAAGSLT
jgi:phage terminase small subunit